MTPESALTPIDGAAAAERHVRNRDRQLVFVARDPKGGIEPFDPGRHVDAGCTDGLVLDVERRRR